MTIALDQEERSTRLIDAMSAMADLLIGRVPGLPVDAEPLAQLTLILIDEARACHAPPAHSGATIHHLDTRS